MDVEEINEIINAKPNLSTALGMEFLSTPEDDTCMARMQVDERNRQPFGFLSGGASLCRIVSPLSWLCLCGHRGQRQPCEGGGRG